MTSAEQIAYLRAWGGGNYATSILAVCDLAERALLTDDEAEAVRRWVRKDAFASDVTVVDVVLRRLLPAPERVEHRLRGLTYTPNNLMLAECSCSTVFTAKERDYDAAVRAWARHAVAEGEEL